MAGYLPQWSFDDSGQYGNTGDLHTWGNSGIPYNLQNGGYGANTGIPFLPQYGGYGSSGMAATPGTPRFNIDWGGISQGLDLVNSAVGAWNAYQQGKLQKSGYKTWKEGTMRGYNANAMAQNNLLRQRENAGIAFAAGHNVNYTPNNTPLHMLQGWGKSGKDVGVDDRKYPATYG